MCEDFESWFEMLKKTQLMVRGIIVRVVVGELRLTIDGEENVPHTVIHND